MALSDGRACKKYYYYFGNYKKITGVRYEENNCI